MQILLTIAFFIVAPFVCYLIGWAFEKERHSILDTIGVGFVASVFIIFALTVIVVVGGSIVIFIYDVIGNLLC